MTIEMAGFRHSALRRCSACLPELRKALMQLM